MAHLTLDELFILINHADPKLFQQIVQGLLSQAIVGTVNNATDNSLISTGNCEVSLEQAVNLTSFNLEADQKERLLSAVRDLRASGFKSTIFLKALTNKTLAEAPSGEENFRQWVKANAAKIYSTVLPGTAHQVSEAQITALFQLKSVVTFLGKNATVEHRNPNFKAYEDKLNPEVISKLVNAFDGHLPMNLISELIHVLLKHDFTKKLSVKLAVETFLSSKKIDSRFLKSRHIDAACEFKQNTQGILLSEFFVNFLQEEFQPSDTTEIKRNRRIGSAARKCGFKLTREVTEEFRVLKELYDSHPNKEMMLELVKALLNTELSNSALLETVSQTAVKFDKKLSVEQAQHLVELREQFIHNISGTEDPMPGFNTIKTAFIGASSASAAFYFLPSYTTIAAQWAVWLNTIGLQHQLTKLVVGDSGATKIALSRLGFALVPSLVGKLMSGFNYLFPTSMGESLYEYGSDTMSYINEWSSYLSPFTYLDQAVKSVTDLIDEEHAVMVVAALTTAMVLYQHKSELYYAYYKLRHAVADKFGISTETVEEAKKPALTFSGTGTSRLTTTEEERLVPLNSPKDNKREQKIGTLLQ